MRLASSLALLFAAVALNTSLSLSAANEQLLLMKVKDYFSAQLAHGQYMKQNCTKISLADWQDVPLQRCNYTELGTKAEVTLALPDAEQLAKWTLSACQDSKAHNIEACTKFLENRIWGASNAQFPVSGYVIEPKSVLGGTSNEPFCFLFRSGVTVRTATVTSRPPKNGKCIPQSAESDAITKAFSFARIASTSRAEFAAAIGAPSEASLAGTAFPEAVRKEFVAAWNSDRNLLISGIALVAMKDGKFN